MNAVQCSQPYFAPGTLCEWQPVGSEMSSTSMPTGNNSFPSDLKGGPWYMYPIASPAPSSCSGRASPCRLTTKDQRQDATRDPT